MREWEKHLANQICFKTPHIKKQNSF